MRNVTWVIDFRRRAPAAEVEPGDPLRALELVLRCRRNSRKMFADTRALLAEARAVLDARSASGRSAGNPACTPIVASRGQLAGLQ